MEECKNLKMYKEPNAKRSEIIRNWMLNKDGPILYPFTEDELTEIEEFVSTGNSPRGGFASWPTAKNIINKLSDNAENDSLVKVLFRLYVEYQWLCGYVHSDFLASMSRMAFKIEHPIFTMEEFADKEVRSPVILRSYVAILIATTVISSHVKDPTTLRAKLSEAWQSFERTDFIAMFAWNTWARSELGILEV